MARSVISLLLVGLLVAGLAFSVGAAGGAGAAYDFADSGVQVFAAPQAEATAAPSALAAAASSVDLGYNTTNFSWDYTVAKWQSSTSPSWITGLRLYQLGEIPAGVYTYNIFYNTVITSFSASAFTNIGCSVDYEIRNGNNLLLQVTVPDGLISTTKDPYGILVYLQGVSDDIAVDSISCTYSVPVEGISSGFNGIYISAKYSNSSFETINVPFGKQPAGDYLINIYHWSVNADVDFSLEYGNRYLTSSTNGGVTTATVSHGGGDLTISGSFSIYRRPEREVYENSSGSIHALSLETLAFYITDVVAVPLTDAGVEQYGIFGPVVSFFRDAFSGLSRQLSSLFSGMQAFIAGQFSGLKSFFSDLFQADKSGEFEEGKTEAGDLVDKNQQLEDQILGGFDDAANAINPGAVTIPNDVLAGFGFISDLFMMVFNGLGNYQALVYVPLMIGICSAVCGRGFTSAMARSSRRPRGGDSG